MLGFFGAESLIKHSNASNGIIWLSNLGCKGEEESIDKCTHRGWGQSTCSHDQDVGITCKPGMVLDLHQFSHWIGYMVRSKYWIYMISIGSDK